VDGQNLFHGAREAFGYSFPNFDINKLASLICDSMNWQVESIYFYTGVPEASDNSFWNHFWNTKLAVMGKKGINIFRRPLRYRNKVIELPDGTLVSALVGIEKGIDVRIAIDIVKFALDELYDVCLIFSQDQDLTEAVKEVKEIARKQGRCITIASAFPSSPTSANTRGIDKTDWIKIDRALYDACIDPYDYRH